jgi:eukaryotic-like serine/threonine-protein kinase
MALVEQSRRAEDGHRAADGGPGPDRWARIKAAFLEALTYSASERSAFIARVAAGDAELHRELQSLLDCEKAASSFCETPAAGVLGALPELDNSPRLPVGTRLGAYEITQFIAAGGMGTVYRARHTLLGRDVALKTVTPFALDGAAKRRLIREARHASSLAHPNICAIYDVGEEGDLPFIVMQYVDGNSLGDIIRDGPLTLHDALHYAIQIAGALEHAHQNGIIHRDLKSSNVVIDGSGTAIVLDFGLARRAPEHEQLGDSMSTDADSLAGTLSHMAPELLRGEAADTRTDIWALGVLVYQLLTGDLPFSGRTPFETSSAILTAAPKPLAPGLPLALRLVVERCLTKDPRQRFQSAHDVGEALQAISRRREWTLLGRLLVSSRRRAMAIGGSVLIGTFALILAGRLVRRGSSASSGARITTLALLPLADSSAEGTPYYADGITDALAAQLGAAGNVRVLSPNSTARVTTRFRSIREIGATLSVDAVARGTLRRSDDRVVVEIELLRSSDGRVVWSDRLSRSPQEILALEADVVRALASAIELQMRAGADARLATVRSVSPEVYESYLKGRYEWNQRTPASLRRAIDHFSRAVQLDPTYAPAHAGLADCYNQLATVLVSGGSPRRYRPLAEAEAIKALQIDQLSAEAHAALGYVRHYQLRWAEAERELRRAIELNPSLSLAHIWYANMLMSRRRAAEAIEQVTIAHELDPFSLVINTNVGWILEEAGRTDEAIRELTNTLALDSTYVQARSRLAGALLGAGRVDEAYAQVTRLLQVTDSAPSVLALRALVDVRHGWADSARVILETLEMWSRERYVPPVSLAHVQAALGDFDDAMRSLEVAYEEGSNAIAYLDVAPEFDRLRRDPRFAALRVRAGLE